MAGLFEAPIELLDVASLGEAAREPLPIDGPFGVGAGESESPSPTLAAPELVPSRGVN